MVQDFCFWAVWAARPVLKKISIMNHELFLEGVFSCFHGQKKFLTFFAPQNMKKTASNIAHNWPRTFFSTGLAAQTAQKQKSRDWIIYTGAGIEAKPSPSKARLLLVLHIFRPSFGPVETEMGSINRCRSICYDSSNCFPIERERASSFRLVS